jgi:hypothetical protein
MRTLFFRHLSAAGVEKLGAGLHGARTRGCARRASRWCGNPEDSRSMHCLSAVIHRRRQRARRPGNYFFAFLESFEILHARDES